MRKCNSYSKFECIIETNKDKNKKTIPDFSFYKNDFPVRNGKNKKTVQKNTSIQNENENADADTEVGSIHKLMYQRNELYSEFKKELLLFNIHKEGITRVRNGSIFCESSDSSRELTDLGESRNPEYDIESQQNKRDHKPYSSGTAFTKLINNLFENPEGQMTNLQRVSIIVTTCFETYRTVISSFLIVFVPQNCGGYSCTILQNIIPKDDLEVVAISINTFMAFYFCTLFILESIREQIVKKYLIIDKSSKTDKETLMEMLSDMEPIEKKEILKLNAVYRVFSQVLLILFFVNASISCIVIWKNYLNNTTSTVFITNMFFTINRIHKSLKISSSGEYNIYSTYRKENLIYNRYRGKVTHARPPIIVFPGIYNRIKKQMKCDQH